jgi:hypothetical protein
MGSDQRDGKASLTAAHGRCRATFRGRQRAKLRYALLAAAAVHGGTESRAALHTLNVPGTTVALAAHAEGTPEILPRLRNQDDRHRETPGHSIRPERNDLGGPAIVPPDTADQLHESPAGARQVPRDANRPRRQLTGRQARYLR